ncbi:MAG: ComEC/Rec2 family competence protein [Bullifex sp.]
MKESVVFALLIASAYFQKEVAVPAFLLWLIYVVRYGRKWLLCFLFTLMLVCACFMLDRVQNSEHESYGFDPVRVSSVTGYVAEDSVPSKWGRKTCVIKLLECNLKSGDVATAKGRLRVSFSGDALYAGDVVRFTGKFSEIGFSAKSMKLLKRLPVTVVRKRFASLIWSRLEGSDEVKELSALLLLGIKSDPESRISELARKSGNSHVLALSGMHLSLFTWMLSLMLTPIFTKRYAKLISLFILLMYIMMTGPKPSLLRAFILSAVFFVFTPRKGIDALILCFLIQLALLPDTVLTLSSLLSYSSLAGIMSLTGVLISSVDAFVYLPEKPLSAFFMTVSALVFTVPFTYKVFGSYQLSSLLTAPFTGVLVYVFMVCSLLGLFLPFSAGMCSYVYRLLMWVMEKGSSVPAFETPDAYYVLVSSVILICLAGLIKKRRVGYPVDHVES